MASRSRSKTVSVRWQHLVSEAASWSLSLVTVAGLAAVGWFGHATHWTFGLAGHAEHHPGAGPAAADHADAEAGGRAEPAAAGDVVRFGSQEDLERSGIEVVSVQERPMVSEVVANGVVHYDERRVAQLSARVSGSVWKVERHLGDRVQRGDILLFVESSEVGRLKAEFLNALVASEARREQLAILEEVKGVVMGRQVREAKSAVREAANHLVNAEQALVNLGFEISLADFATLSDDERAAKVRTLGLPADLLSGVDPERVTSNLIPLRAPFDGVVIGREAVIGEVVEPGRHIFEIADVSRMWVVLSVSKEDAARVAVGQPVRFLADGSGVECTSRVSWISTEVDDATRTLEVRAEIAGSDAAALRANTFGTGRIEVARLGTAVVVPQRSVQWDGSRWVVFVPAGETAFAACAVSPGLREEGHVEIKGDFAGGTPPHVVGEGSHLLKSKILLDRIESGDL
jgi:cobalt-zinc-cadmium efflux system membrane fusion protein